MSYKVYGLKYFHKTPKVFFYLPSIDPLTDGNIFLKISTLYLMTPLNVISSKPKECIIMGDTNINYLDKNNHNDIKDIFMLNGYKQLVTKATWITENSKTLIDKIFTNKPENISKTDTIPTSLSDHDMVGCVRKLNHLKYESKTIHWRNYKDYDPKVLQKDLQEQSSVTYYSFKEPNSAWIYLKSILTHLFDKMHLKLKRKSKAVIVHA